MARNDRRSGMLVGVSFSDLFRAQEFLLAANGLAASGKLKLNDAVILNRDENGKAHVHETIDPTPGQAALGGAVWAGLFGALLGGPVGWAAGLAIGAAGGAGAAKVVDVGISDEWVGWFKDAAQPGTATVALLVEDLDRDAFIAEAQRFTGAHIVYSNLDHDTLDRLEGALGDVHHEPLPDPGDADQGAEAVADVPPGPSSEG